MPVRTLFLAVILGGGLVSQPAFTQGLSPVSSAASVTTTRPQTFSGHGVIQELPPGSATVVIKHEAISNYMAAMTMPFKVREARLLAGLRPGDKISFRLNVTADESWVDQFQKIGFAPLVQDSTPALAQEPPPSGSFMDYALTNELGKKVTLRDFQGQALAITFFYTRCPLPDFCPRLAKNFQAATAKLRSLPGGPTNWHFLSISFDTEFDQPAMLAAYGAAYGARPNEWSFLTGSSAAIRELARISGVVYTAKDGGFQHNFRTLIVDPAGQLQMTFPIGGNISDAIVAQILKAAAVTNQPGFSATTP
jgi:protein SCO1/2